MQMSVSGIAGVEASFELGSIEGESTPKKLAEQNQLFIVDACPWLGRALELERCLVAMSCTKCWPTSATRIELATSGSQGPAAFVGECSGDGPVKVDLSASLLVRRFPNAIDEHVLVETCLPDLKEVTLSARFQVL